MDEFRDAILSLQDQGMKDLILDLQGNGGGMLRTAIAMSDEFLSDDKLIVYTEGRAFEREDTFAQYKGLFEKGRLVVLIDEASASASEIVSGAVQDWDRGLVVGRRSFGKGPGAAPHAVAGWQRGQAHGPEVLHTGWPMHSKALRRRRGSLPEGEV